MSSPSRRRRGDLPNDSSGADYAGRHNSSPERSRASGRVTDDYPRRPRQAVSHSRRRGRSRELGNDDADRGYSGSHRGPSTFPGWVCRSSTSSKKQPKSSRRSHGCSLDAGSNHTRPSSRKSSLNNGRRSSTPSTTRPQRPSPPHDSANIESSRHSSRYYPPSSSRSTGTGRSGSGASPRPPKTSRSLSPIGDVKVWMGAARCAAQAGAVAAMRVRGDPGPWIGPKGTSVATAAIGPAVVDTLVEHKIPNVKGTMRHAVAKGFAQSALGNLVPRGR